MKLKILKNFYGYTLIELLVVFSMAVIFAVFAIPSYVNFSRAQEVRQSALFLKTQLRNAQNSSLSGQKSNSECTENDILNGFFVEMTENQNSFTIGGSCGTNEFNRQLYKLPSSTNKITSFYDASGLPSSACSLLSITNGSLRVNFKPLALGIDFLDWNIALATGTSLNYQKIGIKISDDNNNYYLIIGASGEIYDSAGC